jgi:tetratricopeptide (TPR) repeat protein
VLDLLTSLVQKSLVVYEEDEQGQGRYRLLETVRQYARDRLLEAGEGEAVRERHGECFLQLAEAVRAAAGQGQGTEAFERLEGDHDNLRAALAWSDGREAAGTLRLAGALGEFWYDRGYWDEGREWLERALAAAPAAEPTVERARALAAAGRLTIYDTSRRADYAAARSWLEESVALYRRVADTRGLVEALSYLSELLQRVRNFAVARQVEEEAVALARSLGDPRLLSLVLGQLFLSILDDQVAWMQRKESPALARQVGEECLALARQVGDRSLMAAALLGLGRISQGQGDLAQARELLEESVELARAAKTKHGLARALFFLADVLTQQGDTERAKPLWEECLRLAGELRLLIVGGALASLAVQAPSWEEALQMVAQAAAEYGPIVVRGALGVLVVRAPSYEEALRWIDQISQEYGPEIAFSPLAGLGNAARAQGDYEAAATCYRRSMALRQEVGDTGVLAQCLEDFAGLAARQQQWERAARLLGAAEGACRELVWTLPLGSPEEYKRAVEGARAALGEEAFAAAWAAGRAMSLDEAVRYAFAEA